MPIVLKLNGQTQRYESDTISIGRGTANTISLPQDERLAPVHAMIRLVAGRWIIESKDKGPVRVGTGRPTQFAWLNPGDVIYLTDSGPELQFEPFGVPASALAPVAPPQRAPLVPPIVAARPENVPSPLTSNQAPPATDKVPPTPAAVAVASPGTVAEPLPGRAPAALPSHWWVLPAVGGTLTAVTLFGLIGLIIVVVRLTTAPPVVKTDPQPVIAAVVENKPAPRPDPPEKVTRAHDPRAAVFRLELQSGDKKRTMQLGTAWAVGPRKLVTTGDAARGLAANQERYPYAVARHSLTGMAFAIERTILHPEYQTAANQVGSAIRKIEQLREELQQTQDPAERKNIGDQVHKLESEAILVLDAAVKVNTALLEVSQDVPETLDWSQANAADASPGRQLTLVGHPLSLTDFLVDPQQKISVEERVGKLRHVAPANESQSPVLWLVGFGDDPLKNQNWSGCPVIDASGIVIGIYARPTPPVPGAPAGSIVTHDVTVTESLRALLPGGQ